MKLATLGAISAVVGLVEGVDGLVLTGGVWIALGLLVRLTVVRQRERAQESPGIAPAEKPDPAPGFALGTAIFLTIAASSLAIGLLEVGFADEHRDWRWVPIAVGALVGALGVVSALLHVVGSGLIAAGDALEPDHPAQVTIEAARETGVYINERPRIEFDLLVEPEGLPAYRATTKATVPHTALGSIGVGDGFKAKVDPAKEKRIAIDWAAPLPARGAGDPAERLERLEDLLRRGLIEPEEHEAQRRRIIESL